VSLSTTAPDVSPPAITRRRTPDWTNPSAYATANGFETQTKAHTEYTRMLGEHGLLGLVSVGLLLVMVVQAVRWSTSRWNRIYAAAFAVWSLVSMSHSATSIAAIGFVFGLAQLRSKPGTDLASRPG